MIHPTYQRAPTTTEWCARATAVDNYGRELDLLPLLRHIAMTDTTDMSQTAIPTAEPRTAVIRMVAATEYFKSTGELPAWARNELQSWNRSGTAHDERRRTSR